MTQNEKQTHLVLSRRMNETIVVDGPAVFEVLKRQGNQLKVSIQAPKSTRVIRGELVDQQESQ